MKSLVVDNGEQLPGIRRPAPRIKPEEIDLVLSILEGGCDWMKFQSIGFAWSLNHARKLTERRMRAIAQAAQPKIVSFPGSPGYKLFSLCTVQEIDRCIAARRSQVREETRGLIAFERAYHARKFLHPNHGP